MDANETGTGAERPDAARKRPRIDPHEVRVRIGARAIRELLIYAYDVGCELEQEGLVTETRGKLGWSHVIERTVCWLLAQSDETRDRIQREGERYRQLLMSDPDGRGLPFARQGPPAPSGPASGVVEGRGAGGRGVEGVRPEKGGGNPHPLGVHVAAEPDDAPRRVRRKR